MERLYKLDVVHSKTIPIAVVIDHCKLGDLVTIELGPAVYALGLLTIVWVWAEVALDPHAVWEEIERRGQ